MGAKMLLEDKNSLNYGVGESAVDEQHSDARTIVLHLLPGALVTVFYACAAPVVRSLGFPSLILHTLAERGPDHWAVAASGQRTATRSATRSGTCSPPGGHGCWASGS